MESSEKILSLLKKLYTLAQQGVGGERVNAQQILQTLMKKHNISLEDIEQDQRKKQVCVISIDAMDFFHQVLASVCGPIQVRLFVHENKKKRTRSIIFDCTDAEYIETQAKFAFYWDAWKEERKIFYQAFIQKNKLYSKPSDNPSERRSLTAKEEEEYRRIMAMTQGIKQYHHTRRLDS
jgi:hypothetical protein